MITNTNHMVCFLQVKSGQDSLQHSEAEADNIVLFPVSSCKYSLLIHPTDVTYASLEPFFSLCYQHRDVHFSGTC